MNTVYLKFGILLSLIFGIFTSKGQSINQTKWHFGNNNYQLIFDANGREVNLDSTQAVSFNTTAGVTIIDQFTGNLLSYSDGKNVYDASHKLVANGNDLGGKLTNNVSAVTCPAYGKPGQYFIIYPTTTDIQYAIFNKNLTGNGVPQFPLGEITLKNQSTTLTNPAEGMRIIPKGDGKKSWLISQNKNDKKIHISPIDESGIGASTAFDFNATNSPSFEISHFAYHSDSSWLAASPKTPNANIWLMKFDKSSGSLELDTVLINTGNTENYAIYDLEWSEDGTKLYYSKFGGNDKQANIFQIDLSENADRKPKQILKNNIYRSYGLQRAIDNKIYHLYQETTTSPFSLGRINRPDSLVDSVKYQKIVFQRDFKAKQFPSFSSAYDFEFETLDFQYIDSCQNNTTKFFPIISPTPNYIRWDFGDGNKGSEWIPNHLYENEGGYMVKLSAFIGDLKKIITKPVEIIQSDLQVNLGNDTTICVDETLTLDAGQGKSYIWNTGAITQTIAVDTAGTYWVEVTNDAGCTGFDEITVTEYRIEKQTSNQWYFGEYAGIDFNDQATPILDGNQMQAPEGCATVSDKAGQLLFYTNGQTVWNKKHQIMVNGEDIGGDLKSTQNAMILPFGNDQTMFYIFTTEEVYGDGKYALKYSIVDLKADKARGKVVIKNQKLAENTTERLTASGFTGNDLMLTHDFGNNTFRAYNTTENGLGRAIYSSTGTINSFFEENNASGYLKFSPDSKRIALLLPATNQVEIFDFDDKNGNISKPKLIDVEEPNLYGLEFSLDSKKLYLTSSSENSKLIQYDLDSINSPDAIKYIKESKYDAYETGKNYGALQLAPNGAIYMAVDQANTLGIIGNPNGNDDDASFNPTGFNLKGRKSRLGLPNFAQNQSTAKIVPGITANDGCLGVESEFSAVGRDNSIETYAWTFGDGQSSTEQNPTHTYTAIGTYNVQVKLSNRCDQDTVMSKTIQIFNLPDKPTVPTDTILCGESITLAAIENENPDLTYYWSTGDSTRQITVSQASILKVAVINKKTRCSSDTVEVFVGNSTPAIKLGADQTVCQNSGNIVLDIGIARGTFEWLKNGQNAGNSRTITLKTDQAGTFELIAKATNSFGCVGKDTVKITVQPQPNIDITTTKTTGCGNTDGKIQIQFNENGNYSFSLNGNNNTTTQTKSGAGTATISNLKAGNYTLKITNQTTGCQKVSAITIETPGAFQLTTTSTNVCTNKGTLSLNMTSTPANFEVEIRKFDGQSILKKQLTATFTNPVINTLDTGKYIVSVKDLAAPNCLEADTISIQFANNQPKFDFDAKQSICGAEGTIQIIDQSSGAAKYTWTGSGIVGSNEGTSITINKGGKYIVTANGTGFCPKKDTIEAIFENSPSVVIKQTGDACSGQILLEAIVANGSGNYLYKWSDGSETKQNTITKSSEYSVKITDQKTGCEVNSETKKINIEQSLEVTLSSSPNCIKKGTVNLIATPSYSSDFEYLWQNEKGETLENKSQTLGVTQTGTYSVTISNASGTCTAKSSRSVTVTKLDSSQFVLPNEVIFCTANPENPTAKLDAGVWNTYEWRNANDTTKILSTDRVYSTTEEGTYIVKLSDGFVCTDDQVVVKENCTPVIFAPNAFVPNGLNKTFGIFPNPYVTKFEIKIYNKWGEIIYFSEDKNFKWDGTYKGKLVPPGTYAYIMLFSSEFAPKKGTIKQRGAVTLIR